MAVSHSCLHFSQYNTICILVQFYSDPGSVLRGPVRGFLSFEGGNRLWFVPFAEAELLDCEVKSDSSLEREPVEDDSKGVDGGKKRKRKPYRPGKASD